MCAQSERRGLSCAAGKLVLFLGLISWVPAQALAVFPHHDSRHKEIEGLEMQWRQAQLTGNLADFDRLLADDYLGVSANGTLETKADVLAKRRAGILKITQFDLSDIKVRIYGDTAVVTSKVDLTGKSGDRNISGHYRYTRVYNDSSGQWKIVSFEASRIPDTSEHAEKH